MISKLINLQILGTEGKSWGQESKSNFRDGGQLLRATVEICQEKFT